MTSAFDAARYRDDLVGRSVFGVASTWDPLVRVAQRSAVLRCPRDGRTGTWEDDPFHAAQHAAQVHGHSGMEPAEEHLESGREVHAQIGQTWECGFCGRETRRPRVGRIGSTKDCQHTGSGGCMDTNAAEDAMLRHIDDILPKLVHERP